MATPTSSATSPSPPMAYLSHTPPTPQPMMMNTTSAPAADPQDRDQRQKAVQKFLARAEISMVTRALRARLSYASYKAANNIPHVPLPDLEAQSSHNQAHTFTRNIAAKRKSTAPHYYTPSTPVSTGSLPLRKGLSGTMGPPASVNSPRYIGQPTSATHGHPWNTTAAAPNLYTSILAPPPAKQARTIHNASDPPVPAPARPAPSPRPRTIHHHKSPSRSSTGTTKSRSSKPTPDRRAPKRSSGTDKGKRRGDSSKRARVDADGDVDMKAAATLTSLLLHHRPSAGSTSSPRSSLDGSESGSTLSYSHFAQSSARTMSVASPPVSVSSIPGSTPGAPAEMPLPAQQRTPPPNSRISPSEHSTTPRPAVATEKDSEAADLMLFLATSPSPARPNKPRGEASFQSLASGGDIGSRPKGRVLSFGAGSEGGEGSGGLLQPPSGSGSLSLGVDGASTPRSAPSPPTRTISAGAAAPLLPPPSLSVPPLLPAPTSPGPASRSKSPLAAIPSSSSPKISSVQGTPTQIEFNIHDFINASPSPSSTPGVPTQHKPNHSLRADVGRKLFEEEQMRFAALGKSPAMGGGMQKDAREMGRAWSAGIDIVQG